MSVREDIEKARVTSSTAAASSDGREIYIEYMQTRIPRALGESIMTMDVVSLLEDTFEELEECRLVLRSSYVYDCLLACLPACLAGPNCACARRFSYLHLKDPPRQRRFFRRDSQSEKQRQHFDALQSELEVRLGRLTDAKESSYGSHRCTPKRCPRSWRGDTCELPAESC
jgi:hypothetical protein